MSDIDKITNAELNGKGVRGLPDTPGLTTTEMQNKLDEIAVDVLVPKVNELVENANETNATLGETDISSIGDGTVTGALDTINSNLPRIKMHCVTYPMLHFENGRATYTCDLSEIETHAFGVQHVSICALASIGDFTVSLINGILNNCTVVINSINNPNLNGDYDKLSLLYFLFL